MKKITNILELKKGDKIWRIKNNISVEIIEFLCIHPYNNNYSIFLDCNKDGMPKFYNKNLENSDYYLYDKDSREDMQSERVKKLELWLKNLKRKYYEYKNIDDYNDYNTGLTEIFNGWLEGQYDDQSIMEYAYDCNDEQLGLFNLIPLIIYLKEKEII